MHLVKKFLILVIVVVAFLIIYNLIKSRQTNKLKYAKEKQELKEEGFESPGVSISSLPEKYLSLPIREFIVKSSYNTAINEANIADKAQIQNLLKRGCRLIDFEIYTRNEIEYVSYSEDPEYQSTDTKNESNNRLSLANAFTTAIGYAFSEPAPSPNDPLFVSLRIKNNSAEAYSRIATLIDNNFKNKLYKGEVNRETQLKKIMGKVIIILDTTSSPDYKKLIKCPSSPCFKLSDYVNMEAGSVQFPKYTYANLDTLPQKSVMPDANGLKTNIVSFNMITPAQMDQLKPPEPEEILFKLYPQFLLYKFYKKSDELTAYENIFNESQTSLVPVSTVVLKERKRNSARGT
jgi:hypothetical protein